MDNFSSAVKSAILVSLSISLIVHAVASCPLACSCKWKGGKRKVECAGKNLTAVSPDIDSETQVLDYSKNRLRYLAERIFEKANLTNLQKLYVSECQITRIHETAFRGLSNLIELDLSNNMLSSLPTETFRDFPLLMKLTLSGNPVRVLGADSFAALKYVTNLDLSNCHIDDIELNAFNGLRTLEWLKLDRNHLERIEYPSAIPRITAGLSLHRNPWRCDCRLRTFHKWLSRANEPIVSNPVCAEPSAYRETPIYQLKADDLACAPYVVPSSLFVEINEGKNISFVCQVNAVPEAVITWDFDGNPIAGVADNSSSSAAAAAVVVYPYYKYYAGDAVTEQVSELFVFDAKRENNGTYRCTAENTAGKSTSNYTLKVVNARKNIPEPSSITVGGYFYVLISAVATILVIVSVTLVTSCLVCLMKKKKKKKKSKPANGENTKRKTADVEYEIVRQRDAETVSKTDKNPDLIINTENTTTANSKETTENRERLLLLPTNDIRRGQQSYLTLTGNALTNTTTIYETKALRGACTGDETTRRYPTTVPNGGSTIKLYLSPNSAKKLHNLYVNPFDGYVDSIGQNYWATIQLPAAAASATAKASICENEKMTISGRRQVVIDCCNKTIYDASVPNHSDRYANLRHNLEGYPYPSKLKLTSRDVNRNNENDTLDDTPILSPPDPFKTTGTELFDIHTESGRGVR